MALLRKRSENDLTSNQMGWKSRSEEKVMGFSSSSLFPTRKSEVVTQGGNHGDIPRDKRDNPRS